MMETSKTQEFKAIRKNKNSHRRHEVNKVSCRYEIVSHERTRLQTTAAEQARWKRLTWKSRQKTLNMAELLSEAEEKAILTARVCVQCEKGFGNLLGVRKDACLLCRRPVCTTCLRFPLDYTPPSKEQLQVCRRCFIIMRRIFYRQEFMKRLKEFNDTEFSIWYGTIISLRTGIIRTMPLFRGLVYSLTGMGGSVDFFVLPEEVDVGALLDMKKEAISSQGSLGRQFKNLEKRVKLITKVEVKRHCDELLKRHIGIALAQFLQVNLPEYRFLSKTLGDWINKPAVINVFEKHLKRLKQRKIDEENGKRQRDEIDAVRKSNNDRQVAADKVASPPKRVPKAKSPNMSQSNSPEGGTDIFRALSSVGSMFRPNSPQASTPKTHVDIIQCNPAVLHISGGEIKLRCRGVGNTVKIFVPKHNNAIKPSFIEQDGDETTIKVRLPARDKQGPSAIRVLNAQGSAAEFPIHYIDDPAILQSNNTKRSGEQPRHGH